MNDVTQNVSRCNYIVTISDYNGRRTSRCATKALAWKVIGERSFGGLYVVRSETGKDCSEFVSF